MRLSLVVLLVTFLAPIWARAEFDPTKPYPAPAEETPDPTRADVLQPVIEVTMVKVGPRASVAVADGQVVRPGDVIGGMRVVAITAEDLTFAAEDSEWRFSIRARGGAGSIRIQR